MNKTGKAAEPSMDEILASIRKIIAEEPPGTPPSPPPRFGEPRRPKPFSPDAMRRPRPAAPAAVAPPAPVESAPLEAVAPAVTEPEAQQPVPDRVVDEDVSISAPEAAEAILSHGPVAEAPIAERAPEAEAHMLSEGDLEGLVETAGLDNNATEHVDVAASMAPIAPESTADEPASGPAQSATGQATAALTTAEQPTSESAPVEQLAAPEARAEPAPSRWSSLPFARLRATQTRASSGPPPPQAAEAPVALDTAADPALPSASEIDAPADVAAGLPEQAEAAEAIQPGPAADVQGTPDPTADDAGDSQAGEAGLVDDLSEFVATETTDAPEDLSQEPAPDAHVNGASADFEDLIDAPQPAADGSGDNDAIIEAQADAAEASHVEPAPTRSGGSIGDLLGRLRSATAPAGSAAVARNIAPTAATAAAAPTDTVTEIPDATPDTEEIMAADEAPDAGEPADTHEPDDTAETNMASQADAAPGSSTSPVASGDAASVAIAAAASTAIDDAEGDGAHGSPGKDNNGRGGDPSSSISAQAAHTEPAPRPVDASATALGTALVASAGAFAAQGKGQGQGADVIPPPVRTLEDTVAELLRPMLREWLDAHMPRIVEKALRIEMAQSLPSVKEVPSEEPPKS